MRYNTGADLLTFYRDFTFDNFVELANTICSIDRTDVIGELTDCPRLFTYFHGLMSIAKSELDEYKRKQKDQINYLKIEKRKDPGPHKITDRYLESYADNDDTVRALGVKIVGAEKKYGWCKGIVDGLMQKRDMLVQLSANNRAEANMAS